MRSYQVTLTATTGMSRTPAGRGRRNGRDTKSEPVIAGQSRRRGDRRPDGRHAGHNRGPLRGHCIGVPSRSPEAEDVGQCRLSRRSSTTRKVGQCLGHEHSFDPRGFRISVLEGCRGASRFGEGESARGAAGVDAGRTLRSCTKKSGNVVRGVPPDGPKVVWAGTTVWLSASGRQKHHRFIDQIALVFLLSASIRHWCVHGRPSTPNLPLAPSRPAVTPPASPRPCPSAGSSVISELSDRPSERDELGEGRAPRSPPRV